MSDNQATSDEKVPGKSNIDQTNSDLPKLYLKKNEERRLGAGHLWVYSNEVDTKKTPVKELPAGSVVALYSQRGQFCGNAYVNPRSLICARVFSFREGQALGKELLVKRITAALRLREALYEFPAYRLIHGEGDLLPGLVVDRYDSVLVVQISTAGMQSIEDEVIEALVECLNPAGIHIRSTSAIRELEGLDSREETVHGTVPDTVHIKENGLGFDVPMKGGQKTGWFYDHRENRLLLQKYCQGKRVLDAFCYLGAWGINALAGGATEVVAIDSSQAACDGAVHNAKLNNFDDSKYSVIKGDVADCLSKLKDDAGQKFDVIVLDPPAFIQRAKDKRNGTEKYRKINSLATKLLTENGLLVSASCSHHLSQTDLQRVMLQSARSAGCGLQVLARGHQGPDHPVHAAIPETEYLKTVFARLIR